MLVYLRSDEYYGADDDFRQWASTPLGQRFVERLADVIKSGCHAVVCPGRLLLQCLEFCRLSEVQARALELHHQWLADRSDLRNALHADSPMFTDVLVLTGPLVVQPEGAPEDGTNGFSVREIRRSWQWFADLTEGFTRTKLLGENLNDAAFFEWVGRAYSTRRNVDESMALTDTIFELDNGGGDTTALVLLERSKHPAPVLCVVDSDKKHSGDNLGGTAKKAKKIINSIEAETSQASLVHLVVLDVYTIENALPAKLLRHAVPSSAEIKNMIRRGFFVRPSRSDGGQDWAVLDHLLKFVKPERTKAKSQSGGQDVNEATRNYLQQAYACMRMNDAESVDIADQDLVESVGKRVECTVKWLNQNWPPSEAECGFSSSAHYLCALLLSGPDKFVPEWEIVAHTIWSWGFRPPPRIQTR